MQLNKKDRLALYNQYEILKYLNPEESEGYNVKQEILLNGYKYNYKSLVENFSDGVEEEISEFVVQVFAMYRMLKGSYKKLKEDEKNKVDVDKLSFKGYDSNEEMDFYLYADFLINEYKRFNEIKEDENTEMDSHRNMVGTYKKMLSRWKEMCSGENECLSAEDINQIIDLD